MSSVQFLLAAGLGLLMFLLLANLVVVQYGRGAIQSALDQGARVGAVTGSAGLCEGRIDEVVDQLLGGVMGQGLETGCTVAGEVVTARGAARFESWTPLTPDFDVALTASATRETGP